MGWNFAAVLAMMMNAELLCLADECGKESCKHTRFPRPAQGIRYHFDGMEKERREIPEIWNTEKETNTQRHCE